MDSSNDIALSGTDGVRNIASPPGFDNTGMQMESKNARGTAEIRPASENAATIAIDYAEFGKKPNHMEEGANTVTIKAPETEAVVEDKMSVVSKKGATKDVDCGAPDAHGLGHRTETKDTLQPLALKLKLPPHVVALATLNGVLPVLRSLAAAEVMLKLHVALLGKQQVLTD